MKRHLLSASMILCALALASCSMGAADSGPYSPGGDYQGPQEGATSGDKFEDYGENPFVSAAEQPLSTFSVDSDGASYTVMRGYADYGQKPPVASVRIEEYLNFFTYDYPEPAGEHNISLDTETTSCPWSPDHMLVRVGIKGKSIPLSELPPTNYVFLIDVSGSMGSADKLGILKEGFTRMVDVLGERDKVAIVTYSGSVRVLLPSTYCDDKETIKSAIRSLSASGFTAGGAAISMAYDIAVENYVPGGNNRIILGTDSDFNVGASSDEAMVELIESKRDQGIYITVLGVGRGNLNDSMMEKVADKGNGNYEYIDNVSQLDKIFIHERERFHPVAKDTKIQLTFNPEFVLQYRLIGYENRVLNPEDFDDDTKDAGEIGVGQTVTALYEVIYSDAAVAIERAADVSVRYKTPGTEQSLLIEGSVGTVQQPIAQASQSTRFAAAVAAFGMLMKDSQYAGDADKAIIGSLAEGALGEDEYGYRAEFCRIVNSISF